MIERLKLYIDSQKLSISAFEQIIGASDGMIRRAIKNGTDIQSKWLSNISDNFHDLNLEWLITGKGFMLKDQPDVLSLASESHIQYGRENNEIKYLKKIIENQQKIIENQQKELDNKQKIIDKQFNTIEAYAKGKIVNVSDVDTTASKKGVG